MSEYSFEDSLNKALQDPEFRKIWAKSYTSRSIQRAICRAYDKTKIPFEGVAREAKINKKKLEKFYFGEGNPRIKTLNRIAKVFGMKVKIEFVPIDEL